MKAFHHTGDIVRNWNWSHPLLCSGQFAGSVLCLTSHSFPTYINAINLALQSLSKSTMSTSTTLFNLGYWFVRNTEKVRAMFSEWADLVGNFENLNDHPSSIPNYE